MKTVLASACALLVGLLLGAFLFDGSPTGGPERSEIASRDASDDGGVADVDLASGDDRRSTTPPTESGASERVPAAEVEAPEQEEEALFSAALLAYARDGLQRGWSMARVDGMPEEQVAIGMAQFEKLVLGAPRGLGHQLAEARTKAELMAADARRGGAFALFETLLAGEGAPLVDLVSDPGAFEELFARERAEHPVDPLEADLSEGLEPGSTLNYPAGCHRIGNVIDLPRRGAASDVTIAGAGMDATLLVLSTDLSSRGALMGLSIRDCTIFTDGNYLFDQRSGSATVTLDRVRVVGFDSGAGGSTALYFREGVALQARDCVIAGGYGRSPASGGLFDVRHDALLARFERCTIDRVNLRIEHVQPNATIVFANCDLRDLAAWQPPGPAIEAHAGIEAYGTSIAVWDGPTTPRDHDFERDLNELFPDWKARLGQ